MTYSYFYRCQLYDDTGSIEVGFARNFAQELLVGLEARVFRHQFFGKEESFATFFNSRILNRPLKVILKKRTELFQGQPTERYYAFGAEYVD